MSEKRLFLLDGHALVYRAHFAFINRPLINSKGVNTSAMTGFTRTLWDLMKKEKPTHIAVAFDPKGPTFRHEMMDSYKANREEQPDDIKTAMPYIQQIVQAFKIPIICVDNYEADDVIGTLAKQAEREGYKVYMVTPDKDYAQLVSENVFMYKPSRQGNGIEVLGVPEVLEKWDITNVDQVVDMLGLMGDSVDNIPGIPGIGPKTASKLLAKYDTVEGLIEHSHELKGKQKERVEEFAEQGLLSKTLARIEIEVPIKFNAVDYVIEPFDREWLSEIFKELEFRSLSREILGQDKEEAMAGQQGSLFDVPATAKSNSGLTSHDIAEFSIENRDHNYQLVDTAEGRASLLKTLLASSSVCFDTETTSVDPHQAELVGIAFAVEVGEAWYVPTPENQDATKAILEEFRPFFENEDIEKIGQNIKYDAEVLSWYGVEVKGNYVDTMVIHYLLEPEKRHNMDYLAETLLKYKPVSITTLIGKKGKNQLSMRDVPVEKVAPYAAEDADITLELKQVLYPKMEEEGLLDLYQNIEAPLIKVLTKMEVEGVRINSEFLNDYAVELAKEIKELEEEVYETAGVRFNLASPKQVGEVLFTKMEIPYRWKKTKTGQYSTDEAKLTELAVKHPIVKNILRHRGLNKLRSTYVEALPALVNPKSGRIHSSFNQTVAATGRLSSQNPNLQNIPIRTPEGAEVRKAFIARDDDHILLAADYSQIELRIVAALSQEDNLLADFKDGRDIHSATAARVFNVSFDEVTRDQRNSAKTVNFAILYGAGSQRLTQQLEITRTEARELIDNYYQTYPELKHYMDSVIADARTNGYVTTYMGRRRYLRDINSKSSLARSNAERMAMNTPIQGTAADMIKIAMVNIQKALDEGGFKSKMIMQVHDELVFDAHKDEVERLKPLIEQLMKDAIPDLPVPLVVEIGEGNNWLEAH